MYQETQILVYKFNVYKTYLLYKIDDSGQIHYVSDYTVVKLRGRRTSGGCSFTTKLSKAKTISLSSLKFLVLMDKSIKLLEIE